MELKEYMHKTEDSAILLLRNTEEVWNKNQPFSFKLFACVPKERVSEYLRALLSILYKRKINMEKMMNEHEF